MNENESMEQEVQEQTLDQADAFGAGFDEADAAAAADQPEQREPEQAPEADAGQVDSEEGADQQPDEQGAEPKDAGEAEGETKPTAPEQTWEINLLGQRKTVRVQDITPELLQKGMDYDRLHQKYDQTKPVTAMIARLAKQAGMSAEDYVRSVRTEAKMSDGVSEEEAQRAVELEDREAAVASKEAQAKEEADAREGERARIQRDIEEFSKAFPEAYEASRKDPGSIPDSVWAEVQGGMSLTAAYARYAVSQAAHAAEEAKSQARTAQQNQKNAQRSTGSMRSAGSDARNTDAFLAGFEA